MAATVPRCSWLIDWIIDCSGEDNTSTDVPHYVREVVQQRRCFKSDSTSQYTVAMRFNVRHNSTGVIYPAMAHGVTITTHHSETIVTQ
jgi:hypothetical protein